jgi:hypothetical protein
VVEFKLRILLHEPRSPDRRLKAFLNRTADGPTAFSMAAV